MPDCWLDAPAYAECFTHDADYITGGGKLERGWRENVEGHQIIFPSHRADAGKRTIYTATAQKIDDHWIFVGYQNTPLTDA